MQTYLQIKCDHCSKISRAPMGHPEFLAEIALRDGWSLAWPHAHSQHTTIDLCPDCRQRRGSGIESRMTPFPSPVYF